MVSQTWTGFNFQQCDENSNNTTTIDEEAQWQTKLHNCNVSYSISSHNFTSILNKNCVQIFMQKVHGCSLMRTQNTFDLIITKWLVLVK